MGQASNPCPLSVTYPAGSARSLHRARSVQDFLAVPMGPVPLHKHFRLLSKDSLGVSQCSVTRRCMYASVQDR